MKIHEQAVVLGFVLAVVGDLGSLINTAWSGTDLVSKNSALLMQGADAIAGVIGKILKNVKKGGSEHRKNKRPSSKERHEKGQGRKKADQDRAKGRSGTRGRSGSRGRGSRGRGRSGSRGRGRG